MIYAGLFLICLPVLVSVACVVAGGIAERDAQEWRANALRDVGTPERPKPGGM